MNKEITMEEDMRYIFFLVFLFILFFGYYFSTQSTKNSNSVKLQSLFNNHQSREEVLQTIKSSAYSIITCNRSHSKNKKIGIRAPVTRKQHIENLRNIDSL